jgi:hypothetical protein
MTQRERCVSQLGGLEQRLKFLAVSSGDRSIVASYPQFSTSTSFKKNALAALAAAAGARSSALVASNCTTALHHGNRQV